MEKHWPGQAARLFPAKLVRKIFFSKFYFSLKIIVLNNKKNPF